MTRSAHLRREWPLPFVLISAALFLAFGTRWLADLSGAAWFAAMLIWLAAACALATFAVVRHAEELAERLGEPLGTLVLTLAVTSVEVMMVSAVLLLGGQESSAARDALFAGVMLMLNGTMGVALLAGGLRHREQVVNLMGANAFLMGLVPLTVLGLVLPQFTSARPAFTTGQAVFLIVASVSLYGGFLAIQTRRHPDYFRQSDRPAEARPTGGAWLHTVLLLAYLLPLLSLSHQLAIPIDHGTRVLGLPSALGGLLVAAIVLAPESLAAVRAALANELQRSVNLLLGAALAMISLTIPAVLAVGLIVGRPVVLGLDPPGLVLLVLTLAVNMLTFAMDRTHAHLGAVHLALFFAYLTLILAP